MGRPDPEPHRARRLDIADEIGWHCSWEVKRMKQTYQCMMSSVVIPCCTISPTFFFLHLRDSEQGLFDVGVNDELNDVDFEHQDQLCNLQFYVRNPLSDHNLSSLWR